MRQETGLKIEMEAFADYYRPVHVQGIHDDRGAGGGRRGSRCSNAARRTLFTSSPVSLLIGSRTTEAEAGAGRCRAAGGSNFPAFASPKSPFHDKRVREAICLAIDRGGDERRRKRRDGPDQRQLDQQRRPVRAGVAEIPKEHRARQAVDERGRVSNGFNVDWITPVPNYYSRGERGIVSQLQAIGIKSKLQTLERGVFLKKQQAGLAGMAGRPDHHERRPDRPGAGPFWYEAQVKCGGLRRATDRYVRAWSWTRSCAL